MMKRRKGYYSISIVAKMFSVHQQTIRLYEKEGLITPRRTDGNTRIFSEEDIDRLEQVIHLTHKMGVNIAGVQMILKLQKKMKRMQDEMNKTFEQMQGQLEEEGDKYKEELKTDADSLATFKNVETTKNTTKKIAAFDVDEEVKSATFKPGVSLSDDQDDGVAVDDWEVEYDSD